MVSEGITFDELEYIAGAVGERRGWDFSRVRDARDPVPWDYAQVARRYLRPTDRVLDIGTGGGEHERQPLQDLPSLVKGFKKQGCAILARAEYDVGYYFLDVESLIFWLKAIPLPEDFAIELHWQQVAQIVQAYSTPRGIGTNEHRELLVVQKQ